MRGVGYRPFFGSEFLGGVCNYKMEKRMLEGLIVPIVLYDSVHRDGFLSKHRVEKEVGTFDLKLNKLKVGLGIIKKEEWVFVLLNSTVTNKRITFTMLPTP